MLKTPEEKQDSEMTLFQNQGKLLGTVNLGRMEEDVTFMKKKQEKT